MKIITYNINGLRASAKLGLLDFINNFNADIYCFQEVRCSESQAKELIYPSQLSLFANPENKLENYNCYFNCGKVAGYAGTMIICKNKPDKIFFDMGEFWTDEEGRTTTAVFGNLAVVNAYIPNGNSRLEFKMQYLDALNKYLKKLKEKYSVVCVGDFNIAHNEIDLTNPKECKNKSVFLPIERWAFDELLALGLVDCFRYLNPTAIEYSWRSYRSRYDKSYNSWKYRIDYILASEDLKEKLKECKILDEPYSDHLPVTATIF